MHSLSLIAVLAASAHANYIVDVPVQTQDIPPLPTLFKRQDFQAPCAEVAASWSAQKPKATGSVFVPAKVAYDCLQSVPVDKDGDVAMISELKDFMQFQSDLNYLKDGVKTHNAEPLDILGTLDDISKAIQNGSITGEYDVQQRIRLMLLKAGDFHLHWTADIQTPLRFVRPNAELLTFSKDGVSLPEVYSMYDIASSQISNYTASPIKKISGRDVQEVLNEAALQNAFHDQDARYNRLFPNIPQRTMGNDDPAAFVNPLTYPGETTEFEYANGTKQLIQNVAEIQSPFSFVNVKDGDSFFKQFCTGTISRTTVTTTTETKEDGDSIKDSDLLPTAVAEHSIEVFENPNETKQEGDTVNEADAFPTAVAQNGIEVLEEPSEGGHHTKPHYDENKKHWSRDVSETDRKYIQEAIDRAKAKNKDTPTQNNDDGVTPVSAALPAGTAAVNQPTDYPVPVIVQSSLALQTYYMNDTGYDDIAVLVMPSFGPSINREFTNEIYAQREWQTVLKTFLAGAAKDKKKRLVVDLRGNTGGTIDVGFETFKQIFPDMDPFGATRYRAHQAFEIFSSAIADFTENATFAANNAVLANRLQNVESTWDYKNIMNENGEPYSSFKDYYGPFNNNKDQFTALRRYNWSNLESGYTSAGTFNLTGYADQAPAPARVFQAENIIIIQDGLCGSTCAIFSQLMREQGNVHTIAVGGRPLEAPMQGVGGTKGAQVIDFSYMQDRLMEVLNATELVYGTDTLNAVKESPLGRLVEATHLERRSAHTNSNLPIFLRFNSLDNIRNRKVRKDLSEDELNTPLEFVYEAADCRLFNTFETLKSPIPMWKMAADAKWGKGQCVKGSTNDPSAVGSVFQVAFNKDVNGNPPKSNGDQPPGAKDSPDSNKGQNNNNNEDKDGKKGAASGLQVSSLIMAVAALGAVAALL